MVAVGFPFWVLGATGGREFLLAAVFGGWAFILFLGPFLFKSLGSFVNEPVFYLLSEGLWIVVALEGFVDAEEALLVLVFATDGFAMLPAVLFVLPMHNNREEEVGLIEGNSL